MFLQPRGTLDWGIQKENLRNLKLKDKLGEQKLAFRVGENPLTILSFSKLPHLINQLNTLYYPPESQRTNYSRRIFTATSIKKVSELESSIPLMLIMSSATR